MKISALRKASRGASLLNPSRHGCRISCRISCANVDSPASRTVSSILEHRKNTTEIAVDTSKKAWRPLRISDLYLASPWNRAVGHSRGPELMRKRCSCFNGVPQSRRYQAREPLDGWMEDNPGRRPGIATLKGKSGPATSLGSQAGGLYGHRAADLAVLTSARSKA